MKKYLFLFASLLLLFNTQNAYSQAASATVENPPALSETQPKTKTTKQAQEVLTIETLQEIEEAQKHKEILTNETMLKIDSTEETKGAGSFTILERDADQGSTLPESFDPQAIQAMQRQMEASLDTSMQQQVPGLIFGIIKVLAVPLIIVFIIAFFINRSIDGPPPEGKRAGLFRRFIAISFDAYIGSVAIGAAISLPGLIVPLDDPAAKPIYLLAVLVGGGAAIYMIFGYAIWSNTYGRYLMNVKVLDAASQNKPRFGQAFKRSLTMIFWPIEGIILLISQSKRRMGDVWAGTQVIVVQNPKGLLARGGFGIVIIIIGLILNYGITPLSLNKMHITNTARNYLQRNHIAVSKNPTDASINANPQGVFGSVAFKLKNDPDGKSIVLQLVHQNDAWIISEVHYIKKKYFGLLTYTY